MILHFPHSVFNASNVSYFFRSEDMETESLLFVCLDGHGIHGDSVSQVSIYSYNFIVDMRTEDTSLIDPTFLVLFNYVVRKARDRVRAICSPSLRH